VGNDAILREACVKYSTSKGVTGIVDNSISQLQQLFPLGGSYPRLIPWRDGDVVSLNPYPYPPHVSLSDLPYQSLLCIFAHATCSATIQKKRNKKRMQEKGRKHEKKKRKETRPVHSFDKQSFAACHQSYPTLAIFLLAG
jgi:hypothetical protein